MPTRSKAATTVSERSEFAGQKPSFTALPNWLLGKASALEIAVLWVLQSHYPEIRPSITRLADCANLSRRTVFNVLADLERKGWLVRKHREFESGKKAPNLYRLTIWDGEPKPTGDSAPHALVQEMHHGDSAPRARGIVQEMHHDGAPRAHEVDQIEEEQLEERKPIPPTPLSIATPPPHPPLQGGAAGSDPFRIQQPDQPLTSASPANRQHSTTTTALPPCAEPHRELLTAWWRRRCMNHPTAPRQLDSASITAIEAAAAAGVLEPFLRQAITDAPKTLGFQYRKRIAALSAPGDTTGFDEFRAAYLAVRRRATSQSIPKAITAYASVLANGTTAPQLLAALRANIRAQHEAEAHGGFAACLPDMFRWLRDGLYEAHLPRRGASGIGSGSTPPPNVRRVPDGPVDDPVALCDQLMAARRAAALAS